MSMRKDIAEMIDDAMPKEGTRSSTAIKRRFTEIILSESL